jgi:hypothetical protein
VKRNIDFVLKKLNLSPSFFVVAAVHGAAIEKFIGSLILKKPQQMSTPDIIPATKKSVID